MESDWQASPAEAQPPRGRVLLASSSPTSCNSENPLLPTSGSSSENVGGEVLQFAVSERWRQLETSQGKR